jgi:putative drug exporter of the RND superfamily
MTLSALATSSARHPWRTVGGWLAAVVAAVAAIGALLGGALTTEGNPTNNPQSQRAADVLSAAFPATAGAAVTDIVWCARRGTPWTRRSSGRLFAGSPHRCAGPTA